MSDSLYRKLADLNIIRRAWHLARYDTRTDFIEDPFRYNDFAFKLEDSLRSIAHALENDEYHPNLIMHIDVPKSTLSVRPGSVTSIVDRIVLFAITMLIAPRLEKKLPKTVYSFRLKTTVDNRTLFKDLQILKLPFLKGRTIRKRLDIIEPWYGQWPKFIDKTIYTFEREGYKFLTLSDISAYFENINLHILRDNLINYLPKEQKIVNLLCSILEYWTWPTIHGISIERGIPQGNDASGFLGNVYLLPLDEEFVKFSKRKNIRYFRYMDDVKIFSKEPNIAREAVFTMNNILRKLHLNIQGSKTMILQGEEIRRELIDNRLREVNEIIENIQRNSNSLTDENRIEYMNRLKYQYKAIKKKNKIIQDKDLRLYRRLITGFMLLDSSYMVNNVLKQIPINPDSKLTEKAVKYFKYLPRCSKNISNKLLEFLESPSNLFPYQEAWIINALRYLKEIPIDIVQYARKKLWSKNTDWFIRAQCALLLANLKLQPRSLRSLNKFYKNESNKEVKRALISCLCQLDKKDLTEFLRKLVFENSKRLSSLGRMLFSLLYNHDNVSTNEIKYVFREFYENKLLDSYYKIEVIKHCSKNSGEIRKKLLKKLKAVRKIIKRPHLKTRIDTTIKSLEKALGNGN